MTVCFNSFPNKGKQIEGFVDDASEFEVILIVHRR